MNSFTKILYGPNVGVLLFLSISAAIYNLQYRIKKRKSNIKIAVIENKNDNSITQKNVSIKGIDIIESKLDDNNNSNAVVDKMKDSVKPYDRHVFIFDDDYTDENSWYNNYNSYNYKYNCKYKFSSFELIIFTYFSF